MSASNDFIDKFASHLYIVKSLFLYTNGFISDIHVIVLLTHFCNVMLMRIRLTLQGICLYTYLFPTWVIMMKLYSNFCVMLVLIWMVLMLSGRHLAISHHIQPASSYLSLKCLCARLIRKNDISLHLWVMLKDIGQWRAKLNNNREQNRDACLSNVSEHNRDRQFNTDFYCSSLFYISE